jgi:putative nucleotidyltransferase with HDIG domain
MNDIMQPQESFRMAVSRLTNLPAIPKIAQEIMVLKLNTDEGEGTLLKLIERDPLLSAKVIGLANAPLFGATKKIMSVKDAAIVLGIKRIKMISLSFAMMSSMTQHATSLLSVQSLWQHSLAVATTMHVISRAMPRDIRPADDEIFLAGLLHDIGFLVLNHINPKLSDKFHTHLASQPATPISQIESEMLELNHSELGAELGLAWNLPETIVAVLRYHHQPDAASVAVGMPLIRIANMAENFLPDFGIHEHTEPKITIEELRILGIDTSIVDELTKLLQKNIQEIQATFA